MNRECSLRGPFCQRPGFGQLQVMVEVQVRGTSSAVAMTMRTIHVQIGTGARIQTVVAVEGRGQPRQLGN